MKDIINYFILIAVVSLCVGMVYILFFNKNICIQRSNNEKYGTNILSSTDKKCISSTACFENGSSGYDCDYNVRKCFPPQNPYFYYKDILDSMIYETYIPTNDGTLKLLVEAPYFYVYQKITNTSTNKVSYAKGIYKISYGNFSMYDPPSELNPDNTYQTVNNNEDIPSIPIGKFVYDFNDTSFSKFTIVRGGIRQPADFVVIKPN